MALEKMVYLFGGSKTDGSSAMSDLLGGKGANLAEMSRLGLPVSAGFTITRKSARPIIRTSKNIPRP
jgi:pyruvate,orthophosphate dikinase